MMFDVKELITDLKAINSKSAEYAGLEKRLERLKADFAATTQQLDRVKAELATAEPKLAVHKAKIQQDYDAEIRDKRAQLEKAWIAEEAANHQEGDRDAAIRDRRAVQDGLVHAIAALMARLEGKPEVGFIERLGSGEFHA